MDIRLFFLLVVFCHQTVTAEKLKLCIVKSVHTAKRIRRLCPLLAETAESEVECVIGNDRFNCLRLLTTGNADFTVLEPEDLAATAAYSEYNILVTNELRLFPNEKQHFEMVVLVHKDVKAIWDIKSKRFCHPGLETTDDWTKAFSMYFVNRIIPKMCDPEKSLLENRMMELSNFFESACIAGPWSSDTTLDSKLKSKYRNLCAGCDNPAGCYTSDKYHGREGALLCLTDNTDTIAWARLDDTLEHFKDEQINKKDYNYLCPDDTTRPVDFGKPCVWLSKPWPVIAARSEMAEKVEKMMSSLNVAKFEWERNLQDLLESYHAMPSSTDTLETPQDFLRRFSGFISANYRAPCNPSRRVEWCIASNLEDRKCRWLREASFVYGVEPAISCIREPSRESCLEAVSTGRADIFVAKPHELLEARKKGLKTIIQAVPKKNEDLNRIAAVVKQDSRFKYLKDLKGARACFTGYRDIGWNAFIAVMRNMSGSNSDCSDANIIGNFFEDSCVLGLNDSNREVPSNLYSLCKQAGRAGDDVSTFDCLTSGLGDVAFVNLKAIEQKTGTLTQSNKVRAKNTDYRTLCINEADAKDDSTCLLTWTTLSAIVAHENITDLRREEIYSMLLEMDQLFGQTFNGETPAFSMYGIYDLNYGVIFPNETQHLQFEDHKMQRARDYNDIVNELVKQGSCSGAENLILYDGSTIFLLFLVTIFNRFLIA